MPRSPSTPERRCPARGGKESRITPDNGDIASGQPAEYTYLKLPEEAGLRSCLGVVLAGLTARASIGVGGLEEAVQALEKAHAGGETSYRFALVDGKILAQVEQPPAVESSEEDGEGSRWRTLVELVS